MGRRVKFGQRPGAIPPWEHNARVAESKRWRSLARYLRRVGIEAEHASASMLRLARHVEQIASMRRAA